MSSISGKSRPSAGRPPSDKSAAPVPAPRRSSVSERESFITDCKAAYLAVYSSLNDEIESKQDLCTVLQQAGRSPTSKVLSKYWKANTEFLTFDDFCDICRKEPVTSEDDLIRLFQKIDVNGDGYISNSELQKLLTSRGEKMTADEVQRIINDVDDNGDGKLDYYEFAKMIVRTQEDCKALAYKNMERKLGGSISKSQASPRVQQPAGISDSFGSVEATSHSQTGDVLSTHGGPGSSKQDSGFPSAAAADTDQASSAKRPPPAPPSNRRKQPIVEVSSYVADTAVATSDSDRPMAQSLLGNETLEPMVTVDISQERESERSLPVEFKLQPEKDSMSTPLNNNEVLERPASKPPDEQPVLIEKRSSPENSQLLPSPPQDDHLSNNVSSEAAAGAEQSQRSSAVASVPVSRLDSDSDDDIVIGSSRSTPRVAKLPTYKSDESSKSSSRGGGGGGHDNTREWTQPGINARQLSLTKPKTLRDWKMVKSKGCFLFDEREKILSHQYSLKLSHDSQVWITIEPLSFRPGTDLNSICEASGNPVDMMLFVLNVDNALVAFSEQRDAKGKYALNCELTRGSYQVLAFTSGCRFKPRVTEPRQTVELVQKKGGRVSLNKPFKDALYDIFDMCDLTCNNLWSRDEFRLYNLLTSGQELDDSLWEVVEEKIELQNDQITREGFLTLVQMEAEDSEEDLWVNLTSMGFNKALVMDQASPFMIEVYTERGSPSLKVTKLEEGGKLLTAALVDMVKRKGLESSVRGSKDLHLYSLVSDFRCCFVVENKSPSKQGVVLDCRKSENVVGSHQNGLSAVVDVPSRQSVVVQHLLPKKESQQWTVVCHDSVR